MVKSSPGEADNSAKATLSLNSAIPTGDYEFDLRRDNEPEHKLDWIFWVGIGNRFKWAMGGSTGRNKSFCGGGGPDDATDILPFGKSVTLGLNEPHASVSPGKALGSDPKGRDQTFGAGLSPGSACPIGGHFQESSPQISPRGMIRPGKPREESDSANPLRKSSFPFWPGALNEEMPCYVLALTMLE